jgi:hypothetical protein
MYSTILYAQTNNLLHSFHITDLLVVCWKTSCFQFNEKLYGYVQPIIISGQQHLYVVS